MLNPATNDHTLAQFVAFAFAHPAYAIAFVITLYVLLVMWTVGLLVARFDDRAPHETREPHGTR